MFNYYPFYLSLGLRAKSQELRAKSLALRVNLLLALCFKLLASGSKS